jgi:hypothetical protein
MLSLNTAFAVFAAMDPAGTGNAGRSAERLMAPVRTNGRTVAS